MKPIHRMLPAALLLTACASVPPPLQGEFSGSEPGQAPAPGTAVRWGGRIIDVSPLAGQTCVDVLGLPLDGRTRPRDVDAEIGRFRACQPGFLDPAVFVGGREVTVTGQVETRVERVVGEYRYSMPQLRIDTLFLWPERPQVQALHVYHEPFFGTWPWLPVPVVVYPR